DGHLDGRLAMPLRVVDEITNHSTQQRRISKYDYRLSCDGAVVVPRAFLSRERTQIYFLTDIQLPGSVEAACEKYFVHQLFEFGDISRELLLTFGRRFSELNTEPYAGERGPQLMRCMGKKTLVSIDQIFDPGSSLIEALR